jgi:hypothetical protein
MKINYSIKIAALGAAMTLSSAAVAAEGSIELIVGKGVPVCEAYAASARKWDLYALGCLGDLPLDGNDISRVSGPVAVTRFSMDEDDPTIALRHSAGTFVRGHDVNIANYYYKDRLADWRASNDQLEVARQGLINRTNAYFRDPLTRILQIDVDNDGKADEVYFYPHCAADLSDESTVTMSSPLLLTQDRAAVDTERTLRLLRAPLKLRAARDPHQAPDRSWVVDADIYSNSAFGFLKFRGKTFFDFWWDAGTAHVPERDRNILRVYLAQRKRTEPVCALRINASRRTDPAYKK